MRKMVRESFKQTIGANIEGIVIPVAIIVIVDYIDIFKIYVESNKEDS